MGARKRKKGMGKGEMGVRTGRMGKGTLRAEALRSS